MRVLIFTAFAFLVFPPSFASAQDAPECSIASVHPEFEFETQSYCDFYDRRFEYKKSRDALRSDLEKRQAIFQAERQPHIDDYKAKEAAFHASQ